MSGPITSLLTLQEADVKRLQIEAQLARGPGELAVQDARIAKEKEALETARKELTDLELARRDLDNQLHSAEDQIAKYKTQQATVKKNEEYAALNNQIDTLTSKVDTLETEELHVLMEMDEAEKRFEALKQESEVRIAQLLEQRTAMEVAQRSAESELAVAQKACEDAAKNVAESFLSAYRQAQVRAKAPFVVLLDAHTCQGCHLRVSNDVISLVQDTKYPHHCDHCGRLLYSPE